MRIESLLKDAVAPEVGMGCTELQYSDCHAGTIVSVSSSGKSFTYRRDSAHRTDKNGMSESQTYVYSPSPEAPLHTARLHKDGCFYTAGRTRIAVGYRKEYYDYSF